ncbi:MAG: hypothetical protein AAGF47_03500 [Planctomycetota bacterium]
MNEVVNPADIDDRLRTTASGESWHWLDQKTSNVYDHEGGRLLYNAKDREREYMAAFDSGRLPRRIGIAVVALRRVTGNTSCIGLMGSSWRCRLRRRQQLRCLLFVLSIC